MAPRKKDPTWLYPYMSRERVENLRIYFELHLPNRVRNWNTGPDTHALPREMYKKTPWASVAPHFRPNVQRWFDMMVERTKKQRGSISPGKIRSLRMNAANFGRNILTGRRRENHKQYTRMKNQWLRYKAWEAEQQRKEFVAKQGPLPHKILEVA